jgi:hypothetical protein
MPRIVIDAWAQAPGLNEHSVDPLAGFRLDERVALVIGASSGPGQRIARAWTIV